MDKPAIQYVVEEAVRSGCDDILIVTGRTKRAIEDHFDLNIELEHFHGGREEETLRSVQEIAAMADIHFIRQKEPLGLGHAIYQARKHVGNEPFVVLLGDDVTFSETPCAAQLMEQHEKTGESIVAVEKVPPEKTRSYGMVKLNGGPNERLRRILALVEKPRPEDAPSDLGILGRYLLMPEIFECIRRTRPGHNGEVQLTDALGLLRSRRDVYAYAFEGQRYDLGNKMDWLKTNVEVALMREDFRDETLAFLKEVVMGRDRRQHVEVTP